MKYFYRINFSIFLFSIMLASLFPTLVSSQAPIRVDSNYIHIESILSQEKILNLNERETLKNLVSDYNLSRSDDTSINELAQMMLQHVNKERMCFVQVFNAISRMLNAKSLLSYDKTTIKDFSQAQKDFERAFHKFDQLFKKARIDSPRRWDVKIIGMCTALLTDIEEGSLHLALNVIQRWEGEYDKWSETYEQLRMEELQLKTDNNGFGRPLALEEQEFLRSYEEFVQALKICGLN